MNTATLQQAVAHHLACDASDVALERIPTGKFNTSYVVRADARETVLRIAPADDTVLLFYERRMMHQEPELHDILLRRTEIPVPEILAFDATRKHIDRDFLLMERLPGMPVSELKQFDQDRVLHAVGECLAECHAITRDRYGYLGAHAPMAPQPSWREAFHAMWQGLLDDIVAVGMYDEDEATGLRKLLDRHLAFFDRDDVPASLLHMDVWAQNILVDGGSELSGLLDWDRALWGDPEIEFAVLDYCNISQEAFWAGYGRERDTSRAAHVRQAFYLLYELQKYIVIRAGRQGDRAAADAYKRQAMDLIRQSGLGAPV